MNVVYLVKMTEEISQLLWHAFVQETQTRYSKDRKYLWPYHFVKSISSFLCFIVEVCKRNDKNHPDQLIKFKICIFTDLNRQIIKYERWFHFALRNGDDLHELTSDSNRAVQVTVISFSPIFLKKFQQLLIFFYTHTKFWNKKLVFL